MNLAEAQSLIREIAAHFPKASDPYQSPAFWSESERMQHALVWLAIDLEPGNSARNWKKLIQSWRQLLTWKNDPVVATWLKMHGRAIVEFMESERQADKAKFGTVTPYRG